MIKKVVNHRLLAILSMILLQNCKIADLRTQYIDNNLPNREEKAIALIDKASDNLNISLLKTSEAYSYKVIDNWRGVSALLSPFPRDNKLTEMKFKVNSFDSQLNYLDSKNETIYGIKSLKYYEIDADDNIKFKVVKP